MSTGGCGNISARGSNGIGHRSRFPSNFLRITIHGIIRLRNQVVQNHFVSRCLQVKLCHTLQKRSLGRRSSVRKSSTP